MAAKLPSAGGAAVHRNFANRLIPISNTPILHSVDQAIYDNFLVGEGPRPMPVVLEPEADMLRLSRTDGNALHGNLRQSHRA
jgi:hypothetical protein